MPDAFVDPMPLEPIHRQQFAEPDRAQVQDEAIASAIGRTELHLQRYREDPRSFGGRYVAADLFKETFEQYAASKEARNRYNTPVHNAAAVLSSEQLRRLLAENDPGRDTVVFLTGVPGAGKTSTVIGANRERGGLDRSHRAIFEGQLVRAESTFQKIQQVLDAGLSPVILAVHVLPEVALRGTLNRFREEGRGASIQTMANIQGGLPVGLAAVRERFGDKVELRVFDNRDRANPRQNIGWDNLQVSASEGDREQISQRLRAELERIQRRGELSEAGYRQALGQAPLAQGRGLVRGGAGEHEADGRGRGLSPGDRAEAFLSMPREEALKRYPELKPAFNALRAAELHAARALHDPGTREAFLEHAREHIGNLLREGRQVPDPQLKPADRGISR